MSSVDPLDKFVRDLSAELQNDNIHAPQISGGSSNHRGRRVVAISKGLRVGAGATVNIVSHGGVSVVEGGSVAPGSKLSVLNGKVVEYSDGKMNPAPTSAMSSSSPSSAPSSAPAAPAKVSALPAVQSVAKPARSSAMIVPTGPMTIVNGVIVPKYAPARQSAPSVRSATPVPWQSSVVIPASTPAVAVVPKAQAGSQADRDCYLIEIAERSKIITGPEENPFHIQLASAEGENYEFSSDVGPFRCELGAGRHFIRINPETRAFEIQMRG